MGKTGKLSSRKRAEKHEILIEQVGDRVLFHAWVANMIEVLARKDKKSVEEFVMEKIRTGLALMSL